MENLRRIILIVLTTAIILTAAITLTSCRRLSTLEPEETESSANAGPEVSIEAYRLEEKNGIITVNLSCGFTGFGEDQPLDLSEWVLNFKLSDDYYGLVTELSADPPTEPADFTFEIPDKNSAEFTLEAMLQKKNFKRSDQLFAFAELKIAYGLPQLTYHGVKCVLNAMSIEDKANLVTGHNPVKGGASGGTYEIWRFGVPSITVNDGPAGIRYSHGIWYPSMMNMTSSWDNELVRDIGYHIGGDTLANGIDMILGPGMNIQKNVIGGRNFEYCSEDPYLAGMAASSYVSGVQAASASACVKHYAANNQEVYRGSVSANVTERALREIYLRPFRIVVEKAEPAAVMSSYNCINGTHTSVSEDLLTGILRDEFGFKGIVMSDWGSAGDVVDKVKAGNDLNMPGGGDDKEKILAALENGKLSIEKLDICCERILRMVADSATAKGIPMNTGIDYDGESVYAAAVAPDTMVLLKNEDNALPLKKNAIVALFGSGAYNTIYGGDGSGAVYARQTVNIFDGIDKYKNLSVYDMYGSPFMYCEAHSVDAPEKDLKVSQEYALETASAADAAVIVISRISYEGDDNKVVKGGYYLSDNEFDMIDTVSKAFHDAGKKVTVLLNVGNPIEVMSWRDKVDAIIMIGYPGEGAGTAVAKVLSGEKNPSGKLTMTWPADYTDTPACNYYPGKSSAATYYEDIYVGYRYYSTFDVAVAYQFGFGLSYTKFEYSNFKITETEQGNYYAEVTVKNTGNYTGREVVEFYVSKPETTLEQPEYELCAYAKTSSMKPGQYQTVKVFIDASEIASYDTENSWYFTDSGKYVFYVGSAAGVFQGSQEVQRESLTVIAEAENRCVPKKQFEHLNKLKVES